MPVLTEARALPVVRGADLVLIAKAAHRSVDSAHVEVTRPGAVAVEPFAFYDEPLPPEALAAVHDDLRQHTPEWLVVEVRSAWRHARAAKAL